ncbi:hypothetical protein B0H67DRAFT_554291 [Lasiosphaeris hirsuta]|uniref:Uncharacterized protein n=1 Tax=Lasiosphaeris hirsuta TaxID=260670 RepID=A0AA40DUA8_9PEZI|nr:hypothetical protein B0H67DRAFT_554291 [Lasiosphaeris hirsuta]
MSSPARVPSKAALTALRGLLVGTSCTLALIAEDRRRRINNALRIIENGEKIKSAKRYYSGVAHAARPSTEEAPPDTTPSGAELSQLVLQIPPRKAELKDQPWQAANEPNELNKQSISQFREASAAHDYDHSYGRKGDNQANGPTPDEKPKNIISPLMGPSTTTGSSLRSFIQLDPKPLTPIPDDIVSTVRERCRARKSSDVTSAVKLVLETFSSYQMLYQHQKLGLQDERTREATALLCRTCQEMGRVEDAAAVFLSVTTHVRLQPDEYDSYEPINLIKSLIDPNIPGASDIYVYRARALCAQRVLRPRLQSRPITTDIRVPQIGKTLIVALFALGEFNAVIRVFDCCMRYVDADVVTSVFSSPFIIWLVRKLEKNGVHEPGMRVFDQFFRTSPKRTLSSTQIHAIAGFLIQCATNTWQSSYPAKLLLLLLRLGSGKWQLEADWVIKLLIADWGSHQDFSNTESCFLSLWRANLEEAVAGSDSVYITIVRLALQSNEVRKAESIIDMATDHYPQISVDPRLLTQFAVHHARYGEWDTVWQIYQRMRRGSFEDELVRGRGFVAVLKLFIENHTAHETIEFARPYFDELNVLPCRLAVTLMGKQYASIRDFSELANWLQKCIDAGVKVNDTFSNTILEACHRHGNLPFRHVRTLYRKLELASPDFIGPYTDWVVSMAALEDRILDRRFARGRILSLRRRDTIVPDRYSDKRQILLAMKAAIADRQPARAIAIYKQACHLKMPFNEQCFRVAVQAEMGRMREGADQRINALLQHAQENGADINEAANHVIALRLKEMSSSVGRVLKDPNPAVVNVVRSTLASYEERGITFAGITFNRAAQICLAARQFKDAIEYAHKAAAAENSEPCYHWENFRIIFMSYVEMMDAEGIRKSIAAALTTDYKESDLCKSLLYDSWRRVMNPHTAPATIEQRMKARGIIREGIVEVIKHRSILREKIMTFQEESLGIMIKAARDAGHEPVVDYTNIPWLGGDWPDDEDMQMVVEEVAKPFVNPFKPRAQAAVDWERTLNTIGETLGETIGETFVETSGETVGDNLDTGRKPRARSRADRTQSLDGSDQASDDAFAHIFKQVAETNHVQAGAIATF